MGRIAIVSPRIAVPGLVKGLPSWLKGRASIYDDGVDDRVTGTIPVDMAGAGAFTIRARVRPASRPALVDRGAASFGTNLANQGAFVGSVVVAGRRCLGGGLIGTTLADAIESELCQWTPVMLRVAGGVGGAMTFVAKDRSTSTVVSPNIVGTVAELGRALVAGSCFHGQIADVMIDSRAISDAEYDAWRRGFDVPTAPRRWWTCENPGRGTTVHEEIGNTEDAITGALWDPSVPFRRRRIVEDVAAGMKPDSNVFSCSIAHHDDLDPGAGSFGLMGWVRATLRSSDSIVQKKTTAYPVGPGFMLIQTSSNTYLLCGDGVGSVGVYSAEVASHQHTHLTLALDRTTNLLSIRVNAGPPSAVSSAAIGSLSNAEVLSFGTRLVGVTNSNRGGVYNDWVWRKGAPFTPAESDANYYDGVTPTNPGGGVVQIGWAMREGAGTVVASSPAGYNGTLSAASWTTATRCHARTAA